jgi:DNA-binding HxlR family transcriptional regulator
LEKLDMTQDCVAHDVALDRLLLDQLADKWSLLVLRAFCHGPEPLRFNEIKRRVQGISQKTLTQCLRRLERNGILMRRVIAAAPLGVEYSVTPLGDTLAEPFAAMQRWAEKHLPEVQEAQARFDGAEIDMGHVAVAHTRASVGSSSPVTSTSRALVGPPLD